MTNFTDPSTGRPVASTARPTDGDAALGGRGHCGLILVALVLTLPLWLPAFALLVIVRGGLR